MENSQVKETRYQDDPDRDFRKNYRLPYHHIRQTYLPHTLHTVEYEAYIRTTLELLPPPGGRVLDVGCGDGYISKRAAEQGYRVVGVDNAEDAIAFSRLLVPEAEFVEGDIRELSDHPEIAEGFDAAYCVEVLEHIPVENLQRVLVGIRDCLNETGVFVGSVPSTNIPVTYLHYQHFTSEKLIHVLEAAGFTRIEVFPQWKIAIRTSELFWRFFRNNYYDLVKLRKLLARHVLKHCNRVEREQNAARLLFRCAAAKSHSIATDRASIEVQHNP